MKVYVSEMRKALNKLKYGYNKRSVLPVLENVKFEINEDRIKMTTSDLDVIIETAIILEDVVENDKFLCNFEALEQFFNAIDDDMVTIEKDNELKITYGMFNTFSLPFLPVDEFPQTEINDEIKASLSPISDDVFNSVKEASSFTIRDDIRPALDGILFDFKGGYLNIVATDAHILYKNSIKIEENINHEFIIPSKVIPVLQLLYSHAGTIEFSDNFMIGASPDKNFIVKARLANEGYPKYEAVIPKESVFKYSIPRDEFSKGLKILKISSNNDTNMALFTFNKNTLKIESQNENTMLKSSYNINVDNNSDIDEEFKIAFSIKKLNTVILNSGEGDINIGLTSMSRAGLITNENRKIIIMPLAI